MFRSMMFAAVSAAALVAAPATAAKTYSLAGDFGNAVFSYGTVDGSNNFTAFAASNCNDIGVSSLCYRGSDTYQVEFQANATDVLLHPGPNAGQNSMLMFTARYSGVYNFSTLFTSAGTGDGVNIYSYGFNGLTLVGAVSPSSPTFSYSGSQFLTAGETVGLGVERGGAGNNYFGDSTFFSGFISAPVPEPAEWALLVAGFGLLGAATRRRNRVNVVYA